VKPVRPIEAVPAMATRPRLYANQPRAGSGLFAVDQRDDIRHKNVLPEPVHGAEAVIAELARHHVTVTLSADRQYVIPTAPAGRFLGRDAELFTTAAPLLLAYLRGGEPVPCAVSASHPKGTDTAAVTILAGGAPACAYCLAGKDGAK
jgi:hypothetical protein